MYKQLEKATNIRMVSLPSSEEIDGVVLRLRAPSEFTELQWSMRKTMVSYKLHLSRNLIIEFETEYYTHYHDWQQSSMAVTFERTKDINITVCKEIVRNFLAVTIPSAVRGMSRRSRNEIINNLYLLVNADYETIHNIIDFLKVKQREILAAMARPDSPLL